MPCGTPPTDYDVSCGGGGGGGINRIRWSEFGLGFWVSMNSSVKVGSCKRGERLPLKSIFFRKKLVRYGFSR